MSRCSKVTHPFTQYNPFTHLRRFLNNEFIRRINPGFIAFYQFISC